MYFLFTGAAMEPRSAQITAVVIRLCSVFIIRLPACPPAHDNQSNTLPLKIIPR